MALYIWHALFFLPVIKQCQLPAVTGTDETFKTQTFSLPRLPTRHFFRRRNVTLSNWIGGAHDECTLVWWHYRERPFTPVHQLLRKKGDLTATSSGQGKGTLKEWRMEAKSFITDCKSMLFVSGGGMKECCVKRRSMMRSEQRHIQLCIILSIRLESNGVQSDYHWLQSTSPSISSAA